MANTIGTLFRVTNWGESHGKALGVIVDGCPPKLKLSLKDIQSELLHRKPGSGSTVSTRNEDDNAQILSGLFEGKTTGHPISIIIFNKDMVGKDYEKIKSAYRPGHADFTYDKKYGLRDYLGGGRSSARVTVGHVAAGAIAKKLIKDMCNIEIIAYAKKIMDVEAEVDTDSVSRDDVIQSIVRCPDKSASKRMVKVIEDAKRHSDSVGGIVECVIRNVPAGIGEPLFGKLSAELAMAMFSINAVKGFEIGSGFNSAMMFGSRNNDSFFQDNKKIRTVTNNSGGILGGISTGMPIIFRLAFKPTPSIGKEQNTVYANGKPLKLNISGRHDPCVVPRAVSIVEAMSAIVIADHMLRQQAMCGGQL